MSIRTSIVWLGLALGAAACGFSPTAPFSGFDGEGTRLSGSFDTGVTAQSTVRASANGSYEGLDVSLVERPSLSTTVGADGRFELVGLPSGAWSLLFSRGGQPAGEIRFTSVRQNQGITIVVALTSNDEVVLISQRRDQVSFEGECPRGAGFWCQNQGGRNPNLSSEEFEEFASGAAELLSDIPELDSPEEVAAAVCNTGDQLLRHLATLALNLAAETISMDTPLVGEEYATVGEAFEAAVAVANDEGASRAERNRIKDVLERINENENTDFCEDDGEDDDDTDDPDDPEGGKVTICHIPPGNPDARHTLQIDASAWPAHEAHGDTMGACGS